MSTKGKFSTELGALGTVLDALAGLKEAQQQWVLETAAARLGIRSDLAILSQTLASSGEPSAMPIASQLGRMTPKDFLRAKDPKTDVQRVACLAYYLTHAREKPHFKSRDISVLNTDAAGLKFNTSRAIDNATKQSGYLAPAGKGSKQITAHGEEIVEALPNQESVKALNGKRRPRRKSGSRKGSRKKNS